LLINGTEFGLRLRRVLEKKEVTRNQAAATLEMPGPQLSRYLHGQIPDTRTLLKLARWGNCSMEWLLLGDPGDVEKARGPHQLDDAGTRVLLYGLPTLEEEFERVQKLWDNLEHTYRPLVFQVLELLQPTTQTKHDLSSFLETVVAVVLEEQRSPSMADRISLFKSLLQTCRERLPVEAVEHLWDETGRYLYSQRDATSAMTYAEFLKDVVTKLESRQRQARKELKASIHENLNMLRQGLHPQSCTDSIVSVAARVSGSPAALSRAHWRKARTFRQAVEKFIRESNYMELQPKSWDAFCKEVLRRVLGP